MYELLDLKKRCMNENCHLITFLITYYFRYKIKNINNFILIIRNKII